MPMSKQSINIRVNESKAIGALAEKGVAAAFSDAVRVETSDCVFLYLSGATPIDDEGNLVGSTMKEQTRQVLERLKAVMEHQGGTMADIVRVRVFCTDISSEALRQVHEARNEYFEAGSRPASTLLEISGTIREGGMIEIDADAVIAK